MKTKRFLLHPATLFIFIPLIVILSACTNDLSPASEEGTSEIFPLGEQGELNIPGGMMLVADGSGGAHPVALYDFQIQSQLVSNDQYTKCVETGDCEATEPGENGAYPAGVNWYQAQAYCESIGGRLPTEAELSRVTNQACSESGVTPVSQVGFGEWVYDWDHPDYYNRSLATNPFGPVTGDLKLVLGLDLGSLQNKGKVFPKVEDGIGEVSFKSDEVEFKVISGEDGFSIITEAYELKVDSGVGDIADGVIKPVPANDETGEGVIKPVPANDETGAVAKFFQELGESIFGKFFNPAEENAAGHYKWVPYGEEGLEFDKWVPYAEEGVGHDKWVPYGEEGAEHDKWVPYAGDEVEDHKWIPSWVSDMANFGKFFEPNEQAGVFPRLGVLPEQSSPLIGFRCVTQGMALTYAPICQQSYASYCSPPDGNQTLTSGEAQETTEDPNLTLIGVSCPENGRVIVTIGHNLASGDGIEVKDRIGPCPCEVFSDLPGRIFCSCSSPGEGNTLNLDVCYLQKEILTSTDAFCPPGYIFDTNTGVCVPITPPYPVMITRVTDDDSSGSPVCPSSDGLPLPTEGQTGLSPSSLEDLAVENLDPDEDPWAVFRISDGSGMCPPGYAYNAETGCCSPFSGENYGCAVGQFFDAGSKRCVEVDEDGFIQPSEPWDDNSRPDDSSNTCGQMAYFDMNLGRCVEIKDGCRIGFFLDAKNGNCVPLSRPCPAGNVLHPELGCCVPAPGAGGSRCPEGTDFTGLGCSPGEDGCPPSHYYDPLSDSCLLRLGTEPDQPECGLGLVFNALLGFCMRSYPGDGINENFFTVYLEPGRLASINRVSPDVLDPSTAEPPGEETLCPWGFFSAGEDVCQSALGGDCVSFQITVPFCDKPSHQPSDPTSTCKNPDRYTTPESCKTAGCKWVDAAIRAPYCTYP